jgi:hypothetical protein
MQIKNILTVVNSTSAQHLVLGNWALAPAQWHGGIGGRPKLGNAEEESLLTNRACKYQTSGKYKEVF